MVNLDAMLWGYIKLFFIIVRVCNLDANLRVYFKLSFI